MIYDTFPFFNELELLEVRLNELDPVVDRFVLAEATRTHSNQPKPLLFHANRERFRRFLPKITHIVVDDFPDSTDAWLLEGWQRRAVDQGLMECRPDDIVLHSDLDEIPRASVVARLPEMLPFSTAAGSRSWHGLLRRRSVIWFARNLFKRRHPFVRVLEQRMYYHFLNCVSQSQPVWPGTRAVRYRAYTSAFDLRRWDGRRIADAGWHFSYMGGVERVRQKLLAFAHQEFNRTEFTDAEKIEAALKEGRWALGEGHRLAFEPLDETFPAFVRENRERFRDWIR